MSMTMSTMASAASTSAILINKPASAASSLYQDCLAVLGLLRRVPGFQEQFLDPEFYHDAANAAGPSTPGSTTANTFNLISADPVSQVCGCLRLGSSLCFIFNAVVAALGPPHSDKPLAISPESVPSNLKACQRSAAHFIMGLSRILQWPGQDVFTVTQLYEQDTNGTVKVIQAVRKLLDELDRLGGLLPPAQGEAEAKEIVALDERGKVVKELLESERKYVQDLEILQGYQRELTAADILSQDTIHKMFMNLNTLVDFQRRFLIGLEAHASMPPDDQRLGILYAQMEEGFACYETFCANFTTASELALQENAILSRVIHVTDPSYSPPSLLIKPVQRICKYPLFLQQLVKTSDPNNPHYAELVAGLESVKRVTDRVNETKRRVENEAAVEELGQRVEDWKSHDYRAFGPLLLEEMFNVVKNDTDREFHVYLFERIILCCKEMGATGKKGSKSNSMLKKGNQTFPVKKKNPLQLKGRIFINNVLSATVQEPTAAIQHGLRVTWRGDSGDESFTLKCRTDEQLRIWQKTISKTVEEKAIRRPHYLSNPSFRGRMNSPLSTFPATPQSEVSHYSVTGDQSRQYAAYSHANGFDDENEAYDGYSDYDAAVSSRRNTTGTRSMPPGEREREGAEPLHLRPRAQTQDSTSSLINQWRSQTPTGGYPTGMPTAPPRGTSIPNAHALRSSASSKNLRHKPSQEWGYRGGYTSGAGTPSGDVDEPHRPLNERQTSNASLPSHPSMGHGVGAPPPLMRSRSASSPHVYQPNGAPSWAPYGGDSQIPSVPPLNIPGKANGHPSPAGMPGTSQLSAREPPKRLSSSSQGTDRSSRSSADATQTTATSPASANPSTTSVVSAGSYSSNGPSSAGSGSTAVGMGPKGKALKIRVCFGDDTFTLVCLSSIGYAELVDKVVKKIRLCGDRTRIDEGLVKLRYEDDDGDRINISSDDDVSMAFEMDNLVLVVSCA